MQGYNFIGPVESNIKITLLDYIAKELRNKLHQLLDV